MKIQVDSEIDERRMSATGDNVDGAFRFIHTSFPCLDIHRIHHIPFLGIPFHNLPYRPSSFYGAIPFLEKKKKIKMKILEAKSYFRNWSKVSELGESKFLINIQIFRILLQAIYWYAELLNPHS